VQAAGLRQHLEELASAITEARPPSTAIPALPGQPLTEAATTALTSAVTDAVEYSAEPPAGSKAHRGRRHDATQR